MSRSRNFNVINIADQVEQTSNGVWLLQERGTGRYKYIAYDPDAFVITGTHLGEKGFVDTDVVQIKAGTGNREEFFSFIVGFTHYDVAASVPGDYRPERVDLSILLDRLASNPSDVIGVAVSKTADLSTPTELIFSN